MHIVEVRNAENPPEDDAGKGRLLVGEDRVIPAAQERPEGGEEQQGVERDLDEGRTDFDPSNTEEIRDPSDSQTGEGDVLPERIGHEVGLVTQVGEGFEADINADRGSPRLEKRLGGEHQDLHGRRGHSSSPPLDSMTSRTT